MIDEARLAASEADKIVVQRALAFVAEFNGDPRCALNCVHAEALAAEIDRLRAQLAESERRRVEAEARIAELDAAERRRNEWHLGQI